MIKTEYDNIDELVQDDYDPSNDYEYAKEGFILLMDALKLTEVQKTMLEGGFAYLEDLHTKKIMEQCEEDTRTVQVGSYTFRYDGKVYPETRKITGQEVIDWIRKNNLQDLSIYCGSEYLFARMLDVKDEYHYREASLNWSTDHSKYEVIEDWAEKA